MSKHARPLHLNLIVYDDVIDDAVMEEVSKSRTETSVTALRKPDKKKVWQRNEASLRSCF